MTADPKQPSEIIPPEPNDGDVSASATANAGAHLRMPHFIDQARDWRTLLSAPLATAADLVSDFTRRVISGLVYRLTLTLLLVTAIGVTGFGIWQARHIQLAQFDSFWHSIKTDEPMSRASDVALSDQGPSNPLPLETPLPEENPLSPEDAAGFRPSGDLADLQRRLSALQDSEQGDRPNTPASAPVSGPGSINAQAAAAQLADERAAHDATRAKLLAMQDRLNALSSARATADRADENLVARAALGDLLLRLESGAAYDDVLESGPLARVLRRSERSLLALYADSGVPTRAALLARFEIWIDNRVGATNGAPPMIAARGFYAAVLDWLRHRATGLVQVREAPLATAGADIERIAAALERGRHEEAAWRIGALLRRLDGDISLTHPDRAGLQLLYDDVGAAAELSPMLAALRDDYMAGVRP